MKNKIAPMEITIKLNNSAEPVNCAICHSIYGPTFGPELMLDGTSSTVCRDCGNERAPILTAMLQLADVGARHYGEKLERFAQRMLKEAA